MRSPAALGQKRKWSGSGKTKKSPFPSQTLLFEKRIAEQVLRRALADHRTVGAYCESRTIKGKRNAKEVNTLARAIDCCIDENTVTSTRKSQTVEVLVHRFVAIYMAEKDGNWDTAGHLVGENHDQLDEKLIRQFKGTAKLHNDSTKKTTAKEGAEED